MTRILTLALLTGAIAVGSFGLAAAKAEPAAPNRFAVQLLDIHNAERDRKGVPRLKWSAKLAGEARGWAQELARKGRMEHATAAKRGNAGENLWMGSKGYYSADTMIGAFVNEKSMFRPGKFPDVSTTGNWADVGHYTQLIWRDTQEVGCAVVAGSRDDFLVCRYWPAGNFVGQQVG